jgi:hypothetical protein
MSLGADSPADGLPKVRLSPFIAPGNSTDRLADSPMSALDRSPRRALRKAIQALGARDTLLVTRLDRLGAAAVTEAQAAHDVGAPAA